MGRGRRLLICLTMGLAAWCCPFAAGQSSQPMPDRDRPVALPVDVRVALDETRDFTFNFDQPGFYAIVELVKTAEFAPEHNRTPIVVDGWRDFLERPGDLRGQVVTVAGVVGLNKAPYTLQRRADLGKLWQLELRRDDQPVACTIICTQPADDIPVGATITVTGYFVMVRQYHGPSRRVLQAPLLVAPGPTVISQQGVPAIKGQPLDWRWMVGAVAGGLLVTVWLLWRNTRMHHHQDPRSLHATRRAPMNLADDLQAWAEEQSPEKGEK